MIRSLRASSLAHRTALVPGAALIALCPAPLAAQSGWTFSNLHPAWLESSAGQSTLGPGLTVGYMGSSDESDHHAAVWRGLSSDDVIDVHPSGFAASRITRTSGTEHVGHTVQNGLIRAALWTGDSADSFVSLHPSGMRISYAMGTDGVNQVGFGETAQGVSRAFMWSGSAGSAVSLHPADTGHSYAYDIGGGRQVGYAEDFLNGSSGGYWQGTAESWTPLHAVGNEFGETFTNCISPDGVQQGGWALSRITGVNWAAIWEGSTDTFRSLHPDPSLIGSTVLETDGTYQVGYTINFGQFAAFWSGTSESYVNLHEVLPSNYRSSHAFGVFSDETGVWVTGRASNADRGGWEAVVWHLPVPAPHSAALLLAAGALWGRRR